MDKQFPRPTVASNEDGGIRTIISSVGTTISSNHSMGIPLDSRLIGERLAPEYGIVNDDLYDEFDGIIEINVEGVRIRARRNKYGTILTDEASIKRLRKQVELEVESRLRKEFQKGAESISAALGEGAL